MTGDQARVSVSVAAPRELAFEIFTTEIDRWWRRGAKFRHAGARSGLVHIEPKLDGRLFESFDVEVGGRRATHVVEMGRVRVWEPPARLVFSWRNATFAPDESTEVEVVFAPTASGTLVTVTHRGWAALRPDHPARHGEQGADFARTIGLWWADQLSSLRQLASARRCHSDRTP
jgi:uncharacterized protein YndB with AHSA1/START domain